MNTFRHRLWNTPPEAEHEGTHDFKTRSEVLDYLATYAAEYRLDDRIELNADVRRVELAVPEVSDTEVEQHWLVNTHDGRSYRTRALVMATSPNRVPNRPSFEGEAAFEGDVMHSFGFEDGQPFAGQRVLVVGNGNSGAEISADICDHGGQVTLHSRSPRHWMKLSTKHRLEKYTDYLGGYTQGFFKKLYQTSIKDEEYHKTLFRSSVEWIYNKILYYDLSKFGIQQPKLPAVALQCYFNYLPTVDKGAIEHIESGAIRVESRPIQKFYEKGVQFGSDDTSERAEFDSVILATGYRHGLGDMFSPDVWGDVSTDAYADIPDWVREKYPGLPTKRKEPAPVTDGRSQSVKYPSLFFAGFDCNVAGGLSLGSYSWDVGERLAVMMGKMPEKYRTLDMTRTVAGGGGLRGWWRRLKDRRFYRDHMEEDTAEDIEFVLEGKWAEDSGGGLGGGEVK